MRIFLTTALLLCVIGCGEPSVGGVVTFYPGSGVAIESKSPKHRYLVRFEDDGSTGYFYAWDPTIKEMPILDALHVYDVDDSFIEGVAVEGLVYWSADGKKAMFMLNKTPQAVFDFSIERGYSLNGFPPESDWSKEGHQWDENVLRHFVR